MDKPTKNFGGNQKADYLVSVIIPVFNAESYLQDALDSVICQKDMSFSQDVQVVLIDDGSTDGSRDVCQSHMEKYPNNTVIIAQDNSGTATARNAGLAVARGSYIYFLDSDDKLSSDSLGTMIHFLRGQNDLLESNGVSLLPLVAHRILFFEARNGEHRLNYKFDHGDRIIDLDQEPGSFVLHINSCLFTRKAIGDIQFDPKLQIAQDARFVFDVIWSNDRSYGVVSSSCTWYRKRQNQSSTIDTKLLRKTWYTDTVQRLYCHAFDVSRGEDGHPARFVQHMVMYDLQWRLLQRGLAELNILDTSELDNYRESLIELVKIIDDDIIFVQSKLRRKHKVAILDLKYGIKWRERIRVNDSGSVFYHNIKLYNIKTRSTVDILSMELSKSKKRLNITGRIRQYFGFAALDYRFYFGGKELAQELVWLSDLDTYILDRLVDRGCGFSIQLPIPSSPKSLTCVCRVAAEVSKRELPPISLSLRLDGNKLLDTTFIANFSEGETLSDSIQIFRNRKGVCLESIDLKSSD